MSFKSEVECDGGDCFQTVELSSCNPSQAETEYYNLEAKGWLIEFNDDYDYCPKCAPIVKAEMEEEANDASK